MTSGSGKPMDIKCAPTHMKRLVKILRYNSACESSIKSTLFHKVQI